MKKVIYGNNSISTALENNVKFHKIFHKGKLNSRYEKINCEKADFDKLDFDKYEIQRDARTQGLVALIEMDSQIELKQLINKNKNIENPVFVLLDKITDPQNMGAIIRNVSAFDAAGVIYPQNNQADINPTVINASAGTAFHTDLCKVNSLSKAIEILKDNGYWVVGTKMEADKTLSELKEFNAPLVIVMGNEGKGISEGVQKKCDLTVSIKMNGKAESLNVASASAVILHSLQK